MFKNVGHSLKSLAKALCYLGIGASIILSIAMLSEGEAAIGFAILVCGPFAFWLISLPLYGFGELIDKATEIAENTKPGNKPTQAPAPATSAPATTVKPAPAQTNPAATYKQPPAPATPSVQPTATATPAPVSPASVATDIPNSAMAKEKLYVYAVQMFEQRVYSVAFNAFSKIPDYKDSQEYLKRLKNLL